MTTATRSLPAHGTRARYRRGCDCQPCSSASYTYAARYRLELHRGQYRRTDATPTQEHVQQLLAADWTMADIARAAACSESEIRGLAIRRYATVHRAVAARILAIPTDQPPPAGHLVDATGTVRRIRALVAIGHPLLHIAQASGINNTPLGIIARGGRRQVETRTAELIAALYRRWAAKPGTSQRARNHAGRRGWHGPLAWGEDIDDPAAEPDTTGTRRDAAPDPRRGDHITAEILHLAAAGESEYQIARAVRRGVRYVHDVIRDAS